MDHYDASLGWQWLFIVAAVGVIVIGAGLTFGLIQGLYSIWKRKETWDYTGDPWNGRTLEWSTTSPAPFYNYAVIPEVTERDQWWATKQAKTEPSKPKYKDIYLPKNSAIGIYIAAFAFLLGFGIIWHIWWLAGLGLVGAIAFAIARTSGIGDNEYKVSAAELEALEAKA
jgi:cytochrome o ubiquinol oxidase subunit 1